VQVITTRHTYIHTHTRTYVPAPTAGGQADRYSPIADVLELGVPFTDPIADGPTIQTANTVRRLIQTHTHMHMDDDG